MVFWGRWGARTHVECHDGQPSAAGSHPSPIVISPLWQTDGKTIEKNGSAEKWRKCGIVGNCLRWLRSWGLGKSVAERRAADKKQHTAMHYMGSQPLQCTIWDQEFFWKWWGSESFNSFEDWGKAWWRDEPQIKMAAHCNPALYGNPLEMMKLKYRDMQRQRQIQRQETQIKSHGALQCTIWDRDSLGNDEDQRASMVLKL